MLTPTERQAIIDDIEAGTFDLDDALNDIATEQRGEGVRKAIYGGILLVNEEGRAGAVDVKARQKMELMKTGVAKQISALEKQMGQFIANNSGTTQATKITETTLFSASTPSKADTLTISDDTNNYDYIDVRYIAFGRTGLVRLKPIDVASGCHWTEFENNVEIIINDPSLENPDTNDHTAIRKICFTLQRLDSDTLSLGMYAWRWSGDKTENGVLSANIGSTWSVGIYSITGVKYETVDTTTKDAELTDLRVGYDDTEYESAGEALRAQIQDLWTAVNAINIQAIVVDENGYLRLDGGE